MSNQVTVARVQQYNAAVQHLVQQGESRLRDKVMVATHVGKSAVAVEQIGAVNMQPITTRHGDTVLTETPHARRWVFPLDRGVADMIDSEDKLRMLFDPAGPYSQAHAQSAGRELDQIVIDKFGATAVTGETGTGTEAFTNTIVHGSVGLTVAKLKDAIQLLREQNVQLDREPAYMALTAEQIRNLQDETQMISLDYNSSAILVDGRIRPFMGINFVHTELLPKASTTRTCYIWVKSGMHLGIWQDVTSDILRDPSKWNNWVVQTKLTAGATRVEHARVVGVECTETA